MSDTTSANLFDLETFINGTNNRTGRLSSSLTTVANKANAVMAGCAGSLHPSTPSLAGLDSLLSTWQANGAFVGQVHDQLVLADQYDADGNATVSNAAIQVALDAAGLAAAPGLVTVAAIELYGAPPYSGFVDDPIGLANGNFLLRDGDLEVFGIAGVLSVVRTYNSRDPHVGAFGRGWSSLLDVALDVQGSRVTWRGADGGGAEFVQLPDGSWPANRRRRLTLTELDAGWELDEAHDRTWRFDPDGALTGFTSGPAEITVERSAERVRFTDATSGRWVEFTIGAARRVTASATSDGRLAEYRYDDLDRIVGVRRARGDVAFGWDDAGFLATVVDADGVVACANTYDAEGRVLTQVEHHGRETQYRYRADGVSTVTATDGAPPNVMVHDTRGRMTAMIDGLGNAMRLTYDDDDNVTQVVERTGGTTRFRHDERGNVVERTDPDGLTHRSEWDDLDRLISETDRAGATTRYGYEGDARLPTLVEHDDGSVVRTTLDRFGMIGTVVDPDGVISSIERDADGLVVALVDGLGGRAWFTYDAAGRTVAAVAPDGTEAEIDLAPDGQVAALRTVAGEKRFEYSRAGRMVGGVDERGLAWRADLDAAGEVATYSAPTGTNVAYERDSVGHVSAVSVAGGGTSRFELDPVGRRVATVDPLGGRIEVGYDPEGNPLQRTDESGRTTSIEVDALGRPTVSVAPGGATSIVSYHPMGQVASITDAAGRQWSFAVDRLGRTTSATDPTGATTHYRYTPAGRLAEIESPLGRIERRGYDAAGRWVTTTGADGVERPVDAPAAAPLDLDLLGRLERRADGLIERAVDPAGVATDFTYDDLGRMVAHTTGGSTLRYGWDAAGRLVSLTDAYGNRSVLERDARGVVERILRPDGTATTRTFGPDGRIDGATDADGNDLLAVRRDDNGNVIELIAGESRLRVRREPRGRVTEIATDAGSVGYRWDADGDLAARTDSWGATTFDRAADGELLGWTFPDGRRTALPAEPDVQRDDAGRIVVDERGRRHRYDVAGRLEQATTAGGATTTYAYDDLGLLTTEVGPAGTRRYLYGLAGELLTLGHEDGTSTAFDHDATGRRTRQTRSDGSAVDYRYDASGHLVEVVRTAADGAEQRTTIQYDPAGRPSFVDGVPILWDRATTGSLLGIGDERYLWWGIQVLVATDPDATWDRRVTDDPWGDDGGTGVRLGYRGELAVDGLLLLGARVYDTQTRSFLSPDPLPGVPGMVAFAGAYAYAWNDPVNLIDPSGRRPVSDQDYAAFREAAARGHWRTVVNVGIMVAGAVALGAVMLIPGVNLAAVVIAGAVIGAATSGATTAIDGGSWGDVGRSALIGGIFGGIGAGLGGVINPSTASSLGVRVLVNGGVGLGTSGAVASTQELVDSYLIPGGDREYDWDNVIRDTTIGTVANVGVGEFHFHQNSGSPSPTPAPDPSGGPAPDPGGTPPVNPPSGARSTWDINSATLADLDRIPGIGPVTARAIINARNANGGQITLEQISQLDGIGPSRIQAINAGPPPAAP